MILKRRAVFLLAAAIGVANMADLRLGVTVEPHSIDRASVKDAATALREPTAAIRRPGGVRGW